MEQKKIYIYDPEERPFGALSNNAHYPMYINEKTWPTVTNYILSNMLIVPLYREILQNASIEGVTSSINIKEKIDEILANVFVTTGKQPTKEDEQNAKNIVMSLIQENKLTIYERYEYLLEKEYIDVVVTALKTAYDERLKNNTEMMETLLQTGLRPIIYNSSNKIMGLGPDGKGMNFLGLVLMQLRKFYRSGKEIQKKGKKLQKTEKKLIKLYKAYIFLMNELEDGNDIMEYFDKSALEIPDVELKYSESDDEILKKIINNKLPFIQKELEEPGYMAKYLYENKKIEREAFMREMRKSRILNIYTMYIIRKKYPNMPKEEVEKAADQLISSSPSSEEYNDLKNKITTMYYEGKLDEEITAIIKNYLQEENNIEKEEETRSNSSETYSSGSSDPIAQSFSEKSEKKIIAKKLEKHTGKAYKKLMKKSLKSLKKVLSHYENVSLIYDGVVPQVQSEESTTWLIQYKLKNGKKMLIKKVVGKRPSLQEVENMLKKHNRKNNTSIPLSQAFVEKESKNEPKASISGSWIVKIKHSDGRTEILETLYSKPNESILNDIAKKLNYSIPIQVSLDGSDIRNNVTYIFATWSPTKEEEDEIDDTEINKPIGEPVMIFPIVEQNNEELKQFSPLYEDFFVVNDYSYPSVSMYITTMLITQTGPFISSDGAVKPIISKTTTFKRGMSVQKAREELEGINTIEEATRKYEELKYKTFKELMQTFAQRAIDVKFKNIALQNLLKLTGDSMLIWDDPNNIFLGGGTKETPGDNIVGIILMNKRSEIINEGISEYDKFVKREINSEKYSGLSQKKRMKLINEEWRKRSELTYVNIRNFLTNDVFVKEWAKKRISDMCSTVSKVFNNAKNKGYSEELTPYFVENVLDIIYTPCTQTIAMNNFYFESKPSDEFVLLIKGCGNFPVKSLEIERKIEQKTKDILSSEKEEFHIPNATRREIERKIFEEWNNFINNLLQEKDETFIEKKIQELKEQQKKDTNKNSKELYKERLKLWSSLQNELSKKDISKALIQFNNLQMKTITTLLSRRLTPDKINDITNKISEIKAELFELKKQKKDNDKKYNFLSNELMQIYWEKIVYMIYFLSQHIEKSTEENVRKVIHELEALNSEPQECEIPYKIKNKEERCIVSALYNILKNLQLFYAKMEIEYVFSEEDIKLAEKIIIGIKKKDKKSKSKKEEDKEIEEKDNIMEEAMEEKEEKEENVIELENEADEDLKYVEDNDSDLEDEVADYEDDIEEEYNYEEVEAKFGMNGKSEKRKDIEAIIRDLTNNQPLYNIEELVDAFVKSVNVIKNVKIPQQIKTNRINFFATL